MRVIISKVMAEAMTKDPNWKVGLKLWLDVFNSPKWLHSALDEFDLDG